MREFKMLPIPNVEGDIRNEVAVDSQEPVSEVGRMQSIGQALRQSQLPPPLEPINSKPVIKVIEKPKVREANTAPQEPSKVVDATWPPLLKINRSRTPSEPSKEVSEDIPVVVFPELQKVEKKPRLTAALEVPCEIKVLEKVVEKIVEVKDNRSYILGIKDMESDQFTILGVYTLEYLLQNYLKGFSPDKQSEVSAKSVNMWNNIFNKLIRNYIACLPSSNTLKRYVEANQTKFVTHEGGTFGGFIGMVSYVMDVFYKSDTDNKDILMRFQIIELNLNSNYRIQL